MKDKGLPQFKGNPADKRVGVWLAIITSLVFVLILLVLIMSWSNSENVRLAPGSEDFSKYYLAIFILGGILIILVIVLILLKVYSKSKATRIIKTNIGSNVIRQTTSQPQQSIEMRARVLVNQARARGYSDNEIRQRFNEKNWSNKEIDKILH